MRCSTSPGSAIEVMNPSNEPNDLGLLVAALRREADRRGVPFAEIADGVARAVAPAPLPAPPRSRGWLRAVTGVTLVVAVLWGGEVHSHHGSSNTQTCTQTITPVYNGSTGMIIFCADQPAVA